MAEQNLAGIIFHRGRLVKNPSSFSGTFPYGGTALGATRDVFTRPTQLSVMITYEEYGGVITEGFDIGRSWVLGCNFRTWDNDAIATVFPGITGSGAGISDNAFSASTRAGQRLSSRAVGLLFVPDDVLRHKAIYIPKAIPLIDESAELAHQLAYEWLLPAMFIAFPESSGRLYVEQKLGDIT